MKCYFNIFFCIINYIFFLWSDSDDDQDLIRTRRLQAASRKEKAAASLTLKEVMIKEEILDDTPGIKFDFYFFFSGVTFQKKIQNAKIQKAKFQGKVSIKIFFIFTEDDELPKELLFTNIYTGNSRNFEARYVG